jgi:addiction module HigA family antidote
MTPNGLPPIHPSEFLREILEELDITQQTLAQNLHVSPMRVSHLLKGSRPITAEMALRLGRAFGQSPQYWLNLQASYDLKMAEAMLGDALNAITFVTPNHA